MSETHAILAFITEKPELLERIKVYLNEDTRPAFEDEAPAIEAELFKAMEFAESPEAIESAAGDRLFAWYEFIEEEGILDIFKALDHLDSAIERYAFFADDEEYKAYFRYSEDRLKGIYCIDEDEAIDERLWDMDWDENALAWIIENKG